MASSQPFHPLALVLSAASTAVLFEASSRLDSFLRGLCFGAGLAMLVITLVLVAGMRNASPTKGWRPSRDQEPTSGDPDVR